MSKKSQAKQTKKPNPTCRKTATTKRDMGFIKPLIHNQFQGR